MPEPEMPYHPDAPILRGTLVEPRPFVIWNIYPEYLQTQQAVTAGAIRLPDMEDIIYALKFDGENGEVIRFIPGYALRPVVQQETDGGDT